MLKSPAVWGELLSAWKFGATEWGLLWHCRRHGRSWVFTVERDESWSWAWVVWCGYKLTILERFIEPQHHHARSYKHTAWAMSHNTMTKWKINSEQSKNLATHVIINAWDKLIRIKETNRPTTLTQTNKTPPHVPWSVPGMNRSQRRRLTRQEPDSNPNARLRCNASTGSHLA